MKLQPFELGRRPEPFSHQDWLFEIKFDGFRALAHIEHGRCKLVPAMETSSNRFRTLSESLGTELKRPVVLDGEIVCLDGDGKSMFYDLLFRRGQPRFVAFDLLHCDGQDLTYSPLVERKQRLRAILPKNSQSVLFLLLTGNAAAAEKVFREDLDHNPRNPRSLFGLEQSLLPQKRDYDAGFVRQQPGHIVERQSGIVEVG